MRTYILAWFPMVLIAIANGLFREKILVNRFSELHAHQLSSAIMILLLGVYIWVLFRIWPPTAASQTLWIGLFWLLLTVTFEFLFGHFIAGHSWDKLLNDYNILRGRVWVLVLAWTAIAPYVVYQLQR